MEQMVLNYMNSSGIREALGIPRSAPLDLKPLGQGEYNINYRFVHPISKRVMVIRINTASQMHLEDQIGYEYKALQLLQKTGRTPVPYYVDGSKTLLPYGILVMEYIEGRPLEYERDLSKAAAIFADIHSSDTAGADFLIKPVDPIDAILTECKAMASVFFASKQAADVKKSRLQRIIHTVENRLQQEKVKEFRRCIVNTEVNSGNFIINNDFEGCRLVDWEKPLLSETAQDLAHFLAPTTTCWKTDCILGEEQRKCFIEDYCNFSKGLFDFVFLTERIEAYLAVTCLRGITWCSMAWVEYSRPDRLIRNEYTYGKICEYLDDDFMNMLEERYFNV